MKLIYKQMTEAEQREELLKLLDEAYEGSRAKIFIGTEKLADKAMQIAKNEPKEVANVEVLIDSSKIKYLGDELYVTTLTIEQIEQLYRLVKGEK